MVGMEGKIPISAVIAAAKLSAVLGTAPQHDKMRVAFLALKPLEQKKILAAARTMAESLLALRDMELAVSSSPPAE